MRCNRLRNPGPVFGYSWACPGAGPFVEIRNVTVALRREFPATMTSRSSVAPAPSSRYSDRLPLGKNCRKMMLRRGLPDYLKFQKKTIFVLNIIGKITRHRFRLKWNQRKAFADRARPTDTRIHPHTHIMFPPEYFIFEQGSFRTITNPPPGKPPLLGYPIDLN